MSTTVIKVHAVRPTGLFVPVAWLIMAFQGKNYSHFMIEPVGDNEILDASLPGVRWQPASLMKKKYTIVKTWEFCFKTDEVPKIKEWSKTYEHAPYPIPQNIGAGLVFIGVLKKNPFGKGDKDLNCSELAVVFARDFGGFNVGDTDQYDLVAAEKFLDMLELICPA